MAMTDEDKTKAIQFLVHDVFLPEYNRRLATFLVAYDKQVRKNIQLSMQTGLMPAPCIPLQLDVREPTEQLVTNIVAIEVLFKKKSDGKDTIHQTPR